MPPERDTLRGPPFPCPDCGDSYHRLGRHWSSGACDPAVTQSQRAIIEGLVLSGTSVEQGALVVRNKRRPLVEWTAAELGWLATTLTHVVSDDSDHYELTTPRHHAVERYESWADGPPADYRPSARTARVWWAYAGGLQWSGPYDSQRTATISALRDDRAGWVLRVLDAVPVELGATRAGKRVQWSGSAVDRWLDWLGDPVPGVAYKWTGSLIEYRARREQPASETDYRVALCRHALHVARERTDQRLDAAQFDARVDVVDAATVAAVLGGGSFADALSVTGIDPAPQTSDEQVGASSSAYERLPPADREQIDPTRWSRTDCLDAVRAAAADVDGPLRLLEYTAYRRRQSEPLPSVQYMTETYEGLDSWNDILRAAGLDVVREPTAEATYELFLDGLLEVRERTGEWPTATEYPDQQPEWAPARGTAYRMDEFDGWDDAIADAKQRR